MAPFGVVSSDGRTPVCLIGSHEFESRQPRFEELLIKGNMKELLFSVTKKDLIRQTFRSGGKGGQNQNKVESGVRFIHEPSGARGEARDSRDQKTNERNAFLRLINTKEFKSWHKIECAKKMGVYKDIEKRVDDIIENGEIRGEIKVEYGSSNA